MVRDKGGLLGMREMSALLHHDEASIWQTLAPEGCVRRRHDLVVVAPDYERRQLDPVQPLLEIGIEPARLPTKLRHSKAVLQHHIHLRLARRNRQDAVGEGLVVIKVS